MLFSRRMYCDQEQARIEAAEFEPMTIEQLREYITTNTDAVC